MENVKKYFDVAPLVVPADRESVIRIRPRYEHAAFPAPESMQIWLVPGQGIEADGTHSGYIWPFDAQPTRCEWKIAGDGTLEVRGFFAGEQQHEITIKDRDGNTLWQFGVYSLKPDYYALRPFKGDFHVHTTRSDGLEAPAYVAGRYREEGFDFLALSDHHTMEPSREVSECWAKKPTDLVLLPGEEVHAPDNKVHIVNFGGRWSVNAIFKQDEAAYRREVEARIPGLGEVTPGVDPFCVASCEWVFDKIREAGGVAVFAHPYWRKDRLNILSYALADEIFKRRKFDALEIIGGLDACSNNLQVVRAMTERAAGAEYPLVGVSDSHGTDRNWLFSWFYTIVLAAEPTVEALTAGIKAGNAVAVDAPTGERANCYGSWRMANYAQFLLQDYFPRHAALCRSEGELMLDLAAGDDAAGRALAALSGRTAAYREAAFRDSGE